MAPSATKIKGLRRQEARESAPPPPHHRTGFDVDSGQAPLARPPARGEGPEALHCEEKDRERNHPALKDESKVGGLPGTAIRFLRQLLRKVRDDNTFTRVFYLPTILEDPFPLRIPSRYAHM